MEYTANIEGDDLVHNGLLYRGTDQVGKLCRELKEGTLSLYRNGKLSMTVDVAKRAEQSLSETDKGGLRYVKYKPFPDGIFNHPTGQREG